MRYWHASRFTILGVVFLTGSVILPGCNRSSSGGYHEITERSINHLMALHSANAREMLGNNCNSEVSATVFRSLVPGMQVTLILDLQFDG